MNKKPSEPEISVVEMADHLEDLNKAKPQDISHLLRTLQDGRDLTARDQELLQGVLMTTAERQPQMIQQVVQLQQEIYSGPLPHPGQLNAYDDQTRTSIVKMAVDEQAHVHAMQSRGLEGAIRKDRVGQCLGAVVAVSGLIAAAVIAPHSAAAAAIIGTLDLLGMVAVFVAPRAFEKMVENKAAKPPPKPPQKPRPRKKPR